MEDWTKNPNSYITDDDGNFILKKDGTPRKKTGRPKGSKGRGYNFHSETKAKIKARRAIRTKERSAERIKSRLDAKRDSLNASKETLGKLESPNKNKVVTEDTLDKVPKSLKEEVKDKVNDLVGTKGALIFNEKLEDIKKLPAGRLGSLELDEAPFVIAMDGTATPRIIENCEKLGCSNLIASNFVSSDTDINLVSM